MAAVQSPLRLDADLIAEASVTAPALSRSVAQQIAHWARIGRELEASQDVSLAAITEVLTALAPYDTLSVKEQAVVRANWEERLRELRKGIDLTKNFADKGQRYAELDAKGKVVIRDPSIAELKTVKRMRSSAPIAKAARVLRRA
jgi:ParD-like antitoxin of type II bacterial toxin-antitoxin system